VRAAWCLGTNPQTPFLAFFFSKLTSRLALPHTLPSHLALHQVQSAVGSSLLIVALNGAAGFAGSVAGDGPVDVDMHFAAAAAALSGLGSTAGAAAGRRLPPLAVKLIFSGGVLLIAGGSLIYTLL
jgi:uncharacterized membrane protein YfcA